MTSAWVHVPDDELLLFAEGELPATSGASVAAHVKSCVQCEVRLEQLQSAAAEFGAAHHQAFDANLPAAAGPRALLKAQLADLVAHEPAKGWSRFGGQLFAGHTSGNPASGNPALVGWRHAAFAVVAIAVLLLAGRSWQQSRPNHAPEMAVFPAEPNATLTPGAALLLTRSAVCSTDLTEAAAVIPATLKTKVLKMYGVEARPADAYEVDYLITPELGGATDIRNLWPEPYNNTVWNAHVKDQLENRLRQMVCNGNLDLATAQHDISTDWIAAYRKYFHAEMPLPNSSSHSS